MSRVRRISYCPPLLEGLARAVAALLYRVRAIDAAALPRTGGVLLLPNHLSYVDVVALQIASPRPLRFLAYRGRERQPFFDWVFRRAGVIVLPVGRPAAAVRGALRALERGEVVCLFPEGQISRTGQLMGLQRGFELIARRSGCPVVPVAVDGLWGSLFSFSGGRYLWKRPRLSRTPVTVAFGAPLAAKQATVNAVREALMGRWADAFALRPHFERHLGWQVARSLARSPGRVLIVDRTGDRRPLRAGALFAAGAALAARWRRTVPGRRVGIVLPPGIGACAANLAVLWAGKIPVNLNPTAGAAAARQALESAELDTVISAGPVRSRFPEFPWPERTLDLREELAAAGGKRGLIGWLLAAWVLPRAWAARLTGCPRDGGDAEAAILFTSGSAGRPKGVVLSHRNLLANCEQFFSLSCLSRETVLVGCLPVFHSFGFTVTLWCPLLLGCRVVTVPSPLDTRRIVEAIRDEEATLLICAPTFLRPMLRKAESRELRSLLLVVSGAERLPDDLRREFRQRFHLEIRQGYGLTELAPVCSVNLPDPPIPTATAGPQAGERVGTVGRLLPGVAARVIDAETGAALPLANQGVLCLRGPNRCSGYLGEPASRPGDWFVTGDMGWIDGEGFLTIAGRRSRFSKIGGEMVPHGVIEQHLAEALRCDPAEPPALVVVGVPDAVKGEALVLLTTLPLSLETVRAHLAAAGLPNLWVPRNIRLVERIPLLSTGKLDLAGCTALARA